MLVDGKRFNLYLCLVLALAVGYGCQTAEGKKKKQLSTLRVHLEVNRDASTNRNELIDVPRDNPIHLNVQKAPFISEANIRQAMVTNVLGGFELRLQFDRQGSWLLEQVTAGNPAKRLAIFSQWTVPPDYKVNQGRWLAAPQIRRRITDGVLLFTPDASREEAEQIALGLNNLAKKSKKQEEE